jgi:hypothetical protein
VFFFSSCCCFYFRKSAKEIGVRSRPSRVHSFHPSIHQLIIAVLLISLLWVVVVVVVRSPRGDCVTVPVLVVVHRIFVGGQPTDSAEKQ